MCAALRPWRWPQTLPLRRIERNDRFDSHHQKTKPRLKQDEMESRRIRCVRKPTAWQRWVAHCHAWLEDTLERAVCCGVEPQSLDDKRFSVDGKQASAAFSIRSMSACCLDDSEFENYEDACAALSDTESESTDDHLSDSRVESIDMERRYSTVGECEDDREASERRRASVSSEYVPFEDDDDAVGSAGHCEGDKQESGSDHRDATSQDTAPLCERDLLRRAYFNCVLAELLMTSHPADSWINDRDC